MQILDAAATAQALPWPALLAALRRTLADHAAGLAQVPPRQVLALAPHTRWFVMPSWLMPAAGAGGTTADPSTDLAAIKLITWAAGNPALGLPSILGDVLVLRASTGQRLALLDGPTVTARRTAAVTVLAVQAVLATRLDRRPAGPLLLIGTGVQALAHVQALVACNGVSEVWVRGRSPERSRDFVQALRAQPALLQPGVSVQPADDLAAALQHCPLVVTATPAQTPCLFGPLRGDTLVAAIGAFTPSMIELDTALTRHIASTGRVLLDSADARHEAGDLLLAGLDTSQLPTLAALLAANQPADSATAASAAADGPVLFKSCGHALWDLAAARCAAGLLPPVDGDQRPNPPPAG